MKIANQLNIAWIQNDGRSRDQLVVVHSRPITPSDAEEAWQKTKDGKAIDGFIPIVLLDAQLDSRRLRSWLQARLYVGATCCERPNLHGQLVSHVQIRNRTTASEHKTNPKHSAGGRQSMKQPYELVWTNRDQHSKPNDGQKLNVHRGHGKHLEGCPNDGRSCNSTARQEWTAEKLYEAVCLKGYHNLARELNASMAAERKASKDIAAKATQLHIYNQQLRSRLIVHQKLWRLSAAPSS